MRISLTLAIALSLVCSNSFAKPKGCKEVEISTVTAISVDNDGKTHFKFDGDKSITGLPKDSAPILDKDVTICGKNKNAQKKVKQKLIREFSYHCRLLENQRRHNKLKLESCEKEVKACRSKTGCPKKVKAASFKKIEPIGMETTLQSVISLCKEGSQACIASTTTRQVKFVKGKGYVEVKAFKPVGDGVVDPVGLDDKPKVETINRTQH